MRLAELALVLVLTGILALSVGSLFFSGVQTSQSAAAALDLQTAYADLREQFGRDLRQTSQVYSFSASELRLDQAGLCVQYRLQSGRLFRQTWPGSCAIASGTPVLLLETTTFPTAVFCAEGGSRVGLFDACPLSWGVPTGVLTLRMDNQDRMFAPLLVALRL